MCDSPIVLKILHSSYLARKGELIRVPNVLFILHHAVNWKRSHEGISPCSVEFAPCPHSHRRVQADSTPALARHAKSTSSRCEMASWIRIRINFTQVCRMNNVCKSVCNEALGAWVAVSENSPAWGKRSARMAKAVVASAMTMGAVEGASATVSLDGGTVTTSSAYANGVAIGQGCTTTDDYSVAMGAGAKASGVGNAGSGANVRAQSGAPAGDGRALGGVAVGSNSSAMANNASAFGARFAANGLLSTARGSHAAASATAVTAIGMSAVAERDDTVSIGNATTQRQLVQAARGTLANDAVNVSQLTPLVSARGGTAALIADGSITAPSYTVGTTTCNNVGAALTALGSAASDKYLSANDAVTSTAGATATGVGSIALGGNAVRASDHEHGRCPSSADVVFNHVINQSNVTNMLHCNHRCLIIFFAGWSSLAARRAHNPKVIGSNPIPATKD